MKLDDKFNASIVLPPEQMFEEYEEDDLLDILEKQAKDIVENGKRNSQGTFTWSNGSKYVGGWENGLFNGQGIFSKSNGTKYVGSWKIIDGVTSHWNGKYYDEDGIIKYKWVNGELIKQYKS